MTINCQFGDLGAHSATLRVQAVSPDAGHQAIVRDVLVAEDFSGEWQAVWPVRSSSLC